MQAVDVRFGARARVVFCDDLDETPLRGSDLAAEVRERFDVEVVTPGRVCDDPALLLTAAGVAPAVVVCRAGHDARVDFIASLHRAGTRFDNLDVVAVDPAPGATASDVTAAAVLAVHAAITGVRAEPYPMLTAERARPPRAITRRAAFTRRPVDNLPIPSLSSSTCRAAVGCDICVGACPDRAIQMVADLPVTDAAACTGCASCVVACPINAWRLAGFSTRQMAARLDALLHSEGLPPASGIVLRCHQAQTPPLLGTGWAEVAVPSLGAVTPAMLFQPLANGADSVHLAACDDPGCRSAAASLVDLAVRVLTATASIGAVTGTPALPRALRRRRTPTGRAHEVELNEPVGTLRAVRTLARRDVRVPHESAASAEVSVDATRCSACDVCTRVCPTSSLRSDRGPSGAWALTYDPLRCVACGLCARACPEDALDIRSVIDTSLLDLDGELPLRILSAPPCPSCGQPRSDGATREAAASRLGGHAPVLAALATSCCERCGPAAFGPDGLSTRARSVPIAPSVPH